MQAASTAAQYEGDWSNLATVAEIRSSPLCERQFVTEWWSLPSTATSTVTSFPVKVLTTRPDYTTFSDTIRYSRAPGAALLSGVDWPEGANLGGFAARVRGVVHSPAQALQLLQLTANAHALLKVNGQIVREVGTTPVRHLHWLHAGTQEVEVLFYEPNPCALTVPLGTAGPVCNQREAIEVSLQESNLWNEEAGLTGQALHDWSAAGPGVTVSARDGCEGRACSHSGWTVTHTLLAFIDADSIAADARAIEAHIRAEYAATLVFAVPVPAGPNMEVRPFLQRCIQC